MCLKCGRAAVTQDWKALNVPLVWAITPPWRSWWTRSGCFWSGTGRVHVWAAEWRLSCTVEISKRRQNNFVCGSKIHCNTESSRSTLLLLMDRSCWGFPMIHYSFSTHRVITHHSAFSYSGTVKNKIRPVEGLMRSNNKDKSNYHVSKRLGSV